MPVKISSTVPRLPASAGLGRRAIGEIPETPLKRASALPDEGDFVRALNVFGSLLLDVMPADQAKQDPAVFGAGQMKSFRARVEAFLRDPNSRATKGEIDALRSIALAFEGSRGSDLSFGTARWADFLDFVQSRMPADVDGFSLLAKEVRKANLTDNDPAVFSRTDLRAISSDFHPLLAPAYQGDRFGPDDWARLFVGLVIRDGGDSAPAPTPAPAPAPAPSRRTRVYVAGVNVPSSVQGSASATAVGHSILDAARLFA